MIPPNSSQVGGPPLPVPYENPWGRLAGDLVAVFASLRLQLRALWRRNREGDLPSPSFWPRDLAPLFWPGLLLGLLALGLVLVLALAGGLPRAASSATGPQPVPEAQPVQEIQPEPELQSKPDPQPTAAPQPSALATEAPEPLLTLFAEQDPKGMIVLATAEGDGSVLSLGVAAAFTTATARQQGDLARQWLERAQQLGFDRLEIVDLQGRTIGRQALVGSGMILLSPQHLS
ncbi:hypothetical protein [Cyanobium sp. WAJ14-Wanaka]|uniref:hypothetical protein n=1 Tax=Cyanobium sp. WAJ14-Wanaka TaxID=2823725 RepID=UPI0020CD2052|nr:hypothetical protein [Cyanobium sp. WAJ14-Wanaka]MCP9774680.1 hypothetical protein [Cyanobium sp. WAJ14-Wanaka]